MPRYNVNWGPKLRAARDANGDLNELIIIYDLFSLNEFLFMYLVDYLFVMPPNHPVSPYFLSIFSGKEYLN